MRSKQALKNLMSNMFLQIVVFVSGIILPKFFLEAYGSSVNGMVTSINQFITYLGLAEAGVGTASIVALYAPLADGRQDDVNSILSATRLFYYRSGVIFLFLVGGLTAIYPHLISGQLPNGMVRSMVLVLASSTLVDYLFLGKYKVLLTAMQKGYIVANVQMIGTFLNMVITILLISLKQNVVVVKAVATAIYILRFFLVRAYVKKKLPEYQYNTMPNYGSLKQRGAALLHQIVGIIVNNTDTVILTIMLGSKSLIEVSVYGIYNMIVYAVGTLFTVFSNGLAAGFGEVISKKETEILKKSFSSFEYAYYILFFIVCSCTGILILPFVSIYTQNVTDANYIRPLAAFLFTCIIMLQNIRMPGMTIICAAGHYKETRSQAIREAIINLTVSLLLVNKLGLVGVLTGTVCSYGYRSIEIMIYNHRKLVEGSGRKTFFRVIRGLLIAVVVNAVGIEIIPSTLVSYLEWIKYAIVVGGISSILIIGVNYIFEPHEFHELVNRVRAILNREKT